MSEVSLVISMVSQYGHLRVVADRSENDELLYEASDYRLRIREELKTLSTPKTCVTCKHWQPGEGFKLGGCDELIEVLDYHLDVSMHPPICVEEFATPPDFGCNRHEAKPDE